MVSPAARVFPGRALLVSTAGGLAAHLLGLQLGLVLFFAVVAFLMMGGWRYLRLVGKTLPRDLRLGWNLTALLRAVSRNRKRRNTVPDLFSQTVQRHPDKVAIINVMDGKQWTFKQLDEFSNRVAHHFLRQGFTKGDVVAVFMESCPEFIGVMLGLGKIGAVSALINNNLRHDALAHCITIAKARAVIFSASLAEPIGAVLPNLDPALSEQCYCVGGESVLPQATSLDKSVAAAPDHKPLPPPNKSLNDYLCYIYTSGTTGLPKACAVRNERYFTMAFGSGLFAGIMEDDVVYCTLPLYHTNGGLLATGQMLLRGCTLVVRKKFSASNFWNDCVKHRCTVVYYIGEICRYLLAQPKRPADTQHCVRLASGNGLRTSIWKSFQKRFHVNKIAEFYGSTEGNVSIINALDKVGAVGCVSVVLSFLNPVSLLKIDPQTGEHIRNHRGFCVEADFNEPGEMVGAISKKIANLRFDGYQDHKATERKVLKNVFRSGDAYFLSGDILRMDEDGFLFFCDRTGDTFRWKGENVSTMEVEAIMSNTLELRDVVVYGVEVPGSEGKAGMAAIVGCEKTVALDSLAQKLQLALPVYAVPLFVRLIENADLTGTFKLQKVRLRGEAFNLDVVSDPLFFLHPSQRSYVPFTRELQQQLEEGKIRV